MTYKEIINRIRTVAQNHLMIKDFGYGELSDIKTQAQFGADGSIDPNSQADYPYMFLVQSNAVRNEPVMSYNFSMIMMDMARGEEGDVYDNYLTIQSQCQQYIDDVLANLYYFYRDQPMVQLTGITYQPFKEKYQDEVAGMTVNFTFEVPSGLNECVAPFDNVTELFSSQQYQGGTLDYNNVPPPYTRQNPDQYLYIPDILRDASGGDLNWEPYVLLPGNPRGPHSRFKEAKLYSKIVLTFDMTYTWDPAMVPNATPPYLFYAPIGPIPGLNPACGQNGGISICTRPPLNANKYPDTIVGFPDPAVSLPVVGTTYSVTCTWNNITVADESMFQLGRQVYQTSPGSGCSLNNIAQINMQDVTVKLFEV